MSRFRSITALALLLASASVSRAQNFKRQYVGKDPCALKLKGDYDFSLRLDKTRNLELRVLDKGTASIVMIIEYRHDGPACGVIRDLVQITVSDRHIDEPIRDKHFEFRCFDAQARTDVVVGTIVREGKNTRLMTAIDAWRIDLKEHKFVETHDKVVCSADGFGGEDDGSDLVDEAKKYAAHGKPGQFGPESK
ncbi:MAG: hypothetical protein WB627_03775 [Candidatus Acidiferrum sp.]